MKVIDRIISNLTVETDKKLAEVSSSIDKRIETADRTFLQNVDRVMSMSNMKQFKKMTDALSKRQNEILSSLESWNILFDAIPDLICIIDLEFNIVRANKAFIEKFKTTPEGIQNKKCYSIFHQSEFAPCGCPHLKTINDGKTHKQTHYEEHLGEHYLTTTTLLRDNTGNVFGTIHISRDISDKVKQEKILKKQLEVMARMCNGTDAYIWAKDASDRYKFVNVTFSQALLKVDPVEIVGKSDSEILELGMVDESKNTVLGNCSITDKITKESRRSCRFIEKGLVYGEEVALEVTKNPTFKDNEVFGTIGIAVNITERLPYLEKTLRGLESVGKAVEINSNTWQIFSNVSI